MSFPPPTFLVTTLEAGPQGNPGPPGLPINVFEFIQAQPLTVWTIVHNLGRHPHVTIIDSTPQQVYARVSYPDLNTAIVTFSAPESGIAACS